MESWVLSSDLKEAKFGVCRTARGKLFHTGAAMPSLSRTLRSTKVRAPSAVGTIVAVLVLFHFRVHPFLSFLAEAIFLSLESFFWYNPFACMLSRNSQTTLLLGANRFPDFKEY